MSNICDDLRAAILQAAMQGKLTERLETDDSSERIKEQIVAERSQYKNCKFLDNSNDSVDFPDEWQSLKAGEVFELLIGEKVASGDRLPLLDAKYFRGKQKTFTDKGNLANKDDVLILVDGENSGETFLCAESGYIGSTFKVLFVPKCLNKDFALYFLEMNRKVLRDNKRGSAIPHLDKKLFFNFIFPIPSLAEQKRIVEKVDELMARVADLEQSADALASLKKAFPDDIKASLLQAAMQGKLTEQLPGDGDAEGELGDVLLKQKELLKRKEIKVGKYDPRVSESSELPSGWKYVKLGSIASLITKQTGFDYSKNIKPSLVSSPQNNTYPLIQTRNFKGKRFMFDSKYHIPKNVAESFPNLLLNKPCLLLSIVGASIGNVGLFRKKTIGFIGGAIAKVNLIDDNYLDYVFYFLQSPMGLEQIMKNYKATAQGTITVEDVRNIEIPMPPLLEQKRIIERLDALMQNINAVGELIASE